MVKRKVDFKNQRIRSQSRTEAPWIAGKCKYCRELREERTLPKICNLAVSAYRLGIKNTGDKRSVETKGR